MKMSHRVDSVVRGYHVYKDDWVPGIGDTFQVEVEETNVHDRFACAVILLTQYNYVFYLAIRSFLISHDSHFSAQSAVEIRNLRRKESTRCLIFL